MLEEGISQKKPQLLTRKLQERADIAVIVCSGTLCLIVYTERIEERNMPDPAKMPLEEARRIRDAIKESARPYRENKIETDLTSLVHLCRL
ncbi:MAG: hypothetical protein QW294_07095 [Candidatus Bathyarchaeia archaeon]